MTPLAWALNVSIVRDNGIVFNGYRHKCFFACLFSALSRNISFRYVPPERNALTKELHDMLKAVCPNDDDDYDITVGEFDGHEKSDYIRPELTAICDRFGCRVVIYLILPNGTFYDSGVVIGNGTSGGAHRSACLVLRRDYADGRSNHFLEMMSPGLSAKELNSMGSAREEDVATSGQRLTSPSAKASRGCVIDDAGLTLQRLMSDHASVQLARRLEAIEADEEARRVTQMRRIEASDALLARRISEDEEETNDLRDQQSFLSSLPLVVS
jgi:hypothetical protein